MVALITTAGAVVAAWIAHEPINPAATPPPATAPPSQSLTRPTPGDSGGIPIPGHIAQVEFVSPPEGSEINPGQDVVVSGSVTGLDDNTLWILSRHDVGGSFYLVSGAAGLSPVRTKDGPWSVTDESVGNPSDRGGNVVYYAVQANADCTRALSAMHNYDSLQEPPRGCTILQGLRSVRIK